MTLTLELHTSETAFSSLRDEWNALLHRSASDLIFLTWEWQYTWWQAYQAGDLWIVTCRSENGTLVGIGPWFIQETEGERVIRTIGCVDVTDYVDIIAEQTQVDQVQEALATFLADHHDQYDRVNLCNIQETSSTYQHFPERLREANFEADMVLQEVCPVIHLPDNFEQYLERLDKKQRHEIRRKLRRAESGDTLDYYIVGEAHDFEQEVKKFLRLMAASQPSKAIFLQDEKNLTFFKAILGVMRENGWLQLSFLDINGEPTAAYCDFLYNTCVQVYNSGLQPDAYAHLSPGIVLLAYNIKRAIEQGYKVYDFLRGNETYKYRMGAHDTRVFMLKARAREAERVG